MFVCFGVEARGGGSFGVLRRCNVCSTSGAELSCICISSLVSVRSPLRCGERCGETGEEKMPDIGSRPYSSRTPLSGNVTPVLLYTHQPCYIDTRDVARAYRPTLPTSKYWSCAFLRRPGVMAFPLLLAMGGRFSLSSSAIGAIKYTLSYGDWRCCGFSNGSASTQHRFAAMRCDLAEEAGLLTQHGRCRLRALASRDNDKGSRCVTPDLWIHVNEGTHFAANCSRLCCSPTQTTHTLAD